MQYDVAAKVVVQHGGDETRGHKGTWRLGDMGTRGQKEKIRTHLDLEVYQLAFDAAMNIFEMTKDFPKEETYSLVDQMRRSSRSVCANIAEAWRKRRYKAAFVSKLKDAESEAAERQVWIEFALKCGYIASEQGRRLYIVYDRILGKLVNMTLHPENWTIGS